MPGVDDGAASVEEAREDSPQPRRDHEVAGLCMAEHQPHRLHIFSVYRYLESVKLTSPKKLLIAAKMSRGLTHLRDPGHSVAEVATKLGYAAAPCWEQLLTPGGIAPPLAVCCFSA